MSDSKNCTCVNPKMCYYHWEGVAFGFCSNCQGSCPGNYNPKTPILTRYGKKLLALKEQEADQPLIVEEIPE